MSTASRGGALRVRGLVASYGKVTVLRGVDLDVPEGGVVALLGANGAGKTTTLRAVSGQLRGTGSVTLGEDGLVGRRPGWILRRGVAHVPQGRGTFPSLTVDDNLRVGATSRRASEVQHDLDQWYATFPRLAERRAQAAGKLSGGEQQMLAVARAMMSRPSMLLLDEMSTGLAPNITARVFEELRGINERLGTSMLIVEQNAHLALSIASHGYVLEAGQVVLSGSASDLRADEAVRHAYLRA